MDVSFFRFFLWARFGVLFPMSVEFKTIKPEKFIIDLLEKEKTSHTSFEG